ncbi:MAG: Gfo/Idh/MocA family oxidoreductase [Pirellulaceae bacterium]|nr:Gfo/Idh/MocA family oxidoreductase [Pirellulaceae bacterium]
MVSSKTPPPENTPSSSEAHNVSSEQAVAPFSSRRDFLKKSALAGAGFWVAGNLHASARVSVNDSVNVACIGVGGQGQSDTNNLRRIEGVNVVAICDIDEKNLGGASRKFKDAKQYFDYREMFDKMGKSIDAVSIATPDHTHAPAALRAMRRGLHVYCQKPLTHTIYEARLMGKVARENKVITQMGNQGTALSSLREGAALLQAGVLGRVSEIHVWTNRPVWPQGADRPTETPPVPSHIHWDLWLGAAQERNFHPAYHPFKWRGWWDFGTGALGDMACHTLNLAFMGLDLRDPLSVKAQTSGTNNETFPKWSEIEYEFGQQGERAPLKLRWYDGGRKPEAKLLEGVERVPNTGLIIIGEKGALLSEGDYGQKIKLLGGAEKVEVDYERSPGHFKEWIQGIQSNSQPMSNFPDYASPLTETVLLGNLALKASGQKVLWDAKNLKATGVEGLDAIVNKEYRKGFGIEE